MSEQYQGEDFASYIEGQRTELREARRSAVMARKQMIAEMDAEIARLDSEFAAIDAYERIKSGKMAPQHTQRRDGRVPHGSRRVAIMRVLGNAPDGMTRAELLEALGVMGDKRVENIVSNAMDGLKKRGILYRSEDGRWYSTQVQQDERQEAE
jgi:hypothetical protein